MKYFSPFVPLCLGLCLMLSQSEPIQAQKRSKTPPQVHYLAQVHSAEEIEKMDNKLERVYHMCLGHFSNQTQADTSARPMFAAQEWIAVPIWTERKGEYWVYWTWFMANNPEMVLGQGIYQISKIDRDSFAMQHYFLPEEEIQPLEWAQAKPLAKLQPRDLKKMDCRGILVETGPNRFEVNDEQTCSDFKLSSSGLARELRFQLKLSPQAFSNCSQFLDAEGQVIFEYPKPHGLYMERLDKSKPKYGNIKRS